MNANSNGSVTPQMNAQIAADAHQAEAAAFFLPVLHSLDT